MPEEATRRRARRDKAEGKAASTQAGEFVREEIDHVREGKHGARSTKQAIAIGLSKARRAGVALPPPGPGKTSKETRERAKSDVAKGSDGTHRRPSPRRSRATRKALAHEGHTAASRASLSGQAKTAAAARTPSERRSASQKAARTKGGGPSRRKAVARKAARTRAAHSS